MLWESVTAGSVQVHDFLCFPFTEYTVPSVYLVFNLFTAVHPLSSLKMSFIFFFVLYDTTGQCASRPPVFPGFRIFIYNLVGIWTGDWTIARPLRKMTTNASMPRVGFEPIVTKCAKAE
jgi:hypothetical protein